MDGLSLERTTGASPGGIDQAIRALIAPWKGIMGGLPPLDQISVDTLKQGMEVGFQKSEQELNQLLHHCQTMSGQEFLEAIDQLGSSLSRVQALYANTSNSFSSPELRTLRRDLEPRIAAWYAQVYSDRTLYQRVLSATEDPEISAEFMRYAQRLLQRFKEAGAHLDQDSRREVSEINQALSRLFNAFSDKVLSDEEELFTWLNERDLTGLPEGWISSAKAAAVAHGEPDRWLVKNTRSAVEPFLTLSPHREQREAVWRTFYGRGELRPESATLSVTKEILSLRTRRAQLLGYPTQAHQALDHTMAGSPEAAMSLLREVWGPTVNTFNKELAAMVQLAQEEGFEGEFAPWDVRYYAEKVRQRDYDLDPIEVSQYFCLERLRDGMFWAAEQCFGWRIEPSSEAGPHPDVSVWEVMDSRGEEIGMFYFDPFARDGKRSGAWMSVYRPQGWDNAKDLRIPPLVLNTCNFLKAGHGEPNLLSLSDAQTLFHEFGHAMHGLASRTRLRGLAGTSVVRDFVEFPSQLNERWLTSPELRARFCTHVATGAPLPDQLFEKIEAAANAGSGFATLEYLASAVVDLSLHLAGEAADPATMEETVLSEWGLPPQVVMRHRTPHFSHIFSGDGYASAYYCYLWADTLVADAAELFRVRGFYDSDLCQSYHDLILSRGDSIEASEAFRLFTGRTPRVEPLLKDRGLI